MRNRLPVWFKQKTPDTRAMLSMKSLLEDLKLHTVCESALCPNIGQCFAKGTATFLILGNTCTRNCTFCAVNKGIPESVDDSEPQHLLQAAMKLNLRYVVITSVTRDDLPDGGASHFARIIQLLHQDSHAPGVEVLIPDLLGSVKALKLVTDAAPEVLNHNIETVPRLYPEVRPKANYRRSIDLLFQAKKLNPELITKSGLMLGLGESKDEIIEVLHNLKEVRCDLITLGQYLSPSANHHPVVEYISPEAFVEYEKLCKDIGFSGVASAPLVRSSFNAAQLYSESRNK